MKYVICKRNNVYLPIIGADHVNHSDLVVPNTEIVGAGRFYLTKHGSIQVTPCVCSSIDFTTRDCMFDERLLVDAFNNCGMSQFVDWSSI